MNLGASLRDTWLVARFEVLRAVRTWRALALVVLYVVATAGGAWIFVHVLHTLESALADTLHVPPTAKPGALIDQLLKGKELPRMIGDMIGDQALVAQVLRYPVLAIFHLWESLVLIPFFAASAAAESIAIDLGSRTLRYEAVRTGRLELAMGRFAGQAGLTALASAVGVLGTFTVGMLAMVGNDPVVLLGALLWLTVRGWAFALPFVGLGIAMSQWTASPNWARVLAIGGTAGSWIAWGLCRWLERHHAGVVADVLRQVLPQGWMLGLWHATPGWLLSAGVCAGLGVVLVALGYLRFSRRDL